MCLAKEAPRGPGIHERQVRIQDPLPATLHIPSGRGAGVAEICVPLFEHEARGAREGGGWEKGDHMDPLDVFGCGAEVSRVVDFVLEELEG